VNVFVPKRSPRGFTLIELMVVVCIIGILASVALPAFHKSTLRARRAERDTILTALHRAVEDLIQGQQRVPGGTFEGDWNPATTPGTGKLNPDWTMDGWKELPVIIQGASYYQYRFIAVDPAATGDSGPATLDVFAYGDLDGDGVGNSKSQHFIGRGFSFQWDHDEPADGIENTF
jgi:prepilin-type N-terminal cleavage/methylation domain-containing protein